jgi:hypothetical protein
VYTKLLDMWSYISRTCGSQDGGRSSQATSSSRLLQARKEFDGQMIDDRQIDEQDNVWLDARS